MLRVQPRLEILKYYQFECDPIWKYILGSPLKRFIENFPPNIMMAILFPYEARMRCVFTLLLCEKSIPSDIDRETRFNGQLCTIRSESRIFIGRNSRLSNHCHYWMRLWSDSFSYFPIYHIGKIPFNSMVIILFPYLPFLVFYGLYLRNSIISNLVKGSQQSCIVYMKNMIKC